MFAGPSKMCNSLCCIRCRIKLMNLESLNHYSIACPNANSIMLRMSACRDCLWLVGWGRHVQENQSSRLHRCVYIYICINIYIYICVCICILLFDKEPSIVPS